MSSSPANAWDAVLNQIYPVTRAGTGTVAVADVPNGDPYDILSDSQIGENRNENGDNLVLKVSVTNLSTAAPVLSNNIVNLPLTPTDDTNFATTERVAFPAPAQSPGDVLQAVASVTVNAGSNTDFSTAQSATFVAS